MPELALDPEVSAKGAKAAQSRCKSMFCMENTSIATDRRARATVICCELHANGTIDQILKKYGQGTP